MKTKISTFLVIFLPISIYGQGFPYYPQGYGPPPGVYVPPLVNVGYPPVLPNNYNNTPPVGFVIPPQVPTCRKPRENDGGNKPHELFVGCVTGNDRLLFVDKFVKYGRWWTTREKIVDYPSFGRGVRRNETISGIWLFDKSSDNNGRVSILKGGVGHKNVTLKFYSEQNGSGFFYILQIYGH